MSIYREVWEQMVPGLSYIIDNFGNRWDVIHKVQDTYYPTFILRTFDGRADTYVFKPDRGDGHPGIFCANKEYFFELNDCATKVFNPKKIIKNNKGEK